MVLPLQVKTLKMALEGRPAVNKGKGANQHTKRRAAAAKGAIAPIPQPDLIVFCTQCTCP